MKIYRKSQTPVEDIKLYLVKSGDYDDYIDFVDSQSMGDCQTIVADIKRVFPFVNKIFGEIEIDDSYVDEYGQIQNLVTHHWVEIDKVAYDFSKGSLKSYIEFDDVYDPLISVNELDRYLR